MFQQTVGKCDEPHFAVDNAYYMVPGTKQIVNKHSHLLSRVVKHLLCARNRQSQALGINWQTARSFSLPSEGLLSEWGTE